MARVDRRKFVLDTNCFVDASRTDAAAAAFAEFCAWAAPMLYLSTVVAAERRAGAGSAQHRRILERQILSPYVRRNVTDLSRIAKVFSFDFVQPYSFRSGG